MVVKSYLEDLEGSMRLKRMWKLVPQVGKRGTNGWQRAVILDLGSFTRTELMMDCLHPAEISAGQIMERAEAARPERRWLKTESTDLSAMGK